MGQNAINSNPEFAADLAYQDDILARVSRTFALTIPELPQPLRVSVGNAYLLCRIVDTIEDAPDLTKEEIERAHALFWDALNDDAKVNEFTRRVPLLVNCQCTDSELELVRNADRVLHITRALSEDERRAMLRCVKIMTEGMQAFKTKQTAGGLADLGELDAYCYHVAGVVGEMLTELFCAYSPEIGKNHATLYKLATSFGEGLQLTNILKDVWADRERSVSWLPKELATEKNGEPAPAIQQLVGTTREHLENAVEYVALIPSHETGIRRFCLYAIGMAVLTLRKIRRNPHFKSGDTVKISRLSVYGVVAVARMICWSNILIKIAFAAGAIGLRRGGI